MSHDYPSWLFSYVLIQEKNMKCPNGHARDFYRNGRCRKCDHEASARYRARRKLAMTLLKQMETVGLDPETLAADSGFTIALAWLAADDADQARIESLHPAMVAKIRGQLAA